MRPLILFFLAAIFFFSSCDPVIDYSIPSSVEGYMPVYTQDLSSAKKISAEPPRRIYRGGKIYTTGNLLFQVEADSGIHIINYADPANPQKLGFIRSFLCKELSVKNGFIYTNNLSDLVVIDIRNMNDVKEVNRVPGVFPDLSNQYPPKTNQRDQVWFECPDASKGIVIAWTKQRIKDPKCWR